MRRQNGFTFLELLIVLAIISIIAAIAIPSILRAKESVRMREDPAYSERVSRERAHSAQRSVAPNIQYIRDDRTGLCFAYYWGGTYHGGPALATVPCDKVDKLLP